MRKKKSVFTPQEEAVFKKSGKQLGEILSFMEVYNDRHKLILKRFHVLITQNALIVKSARPHLEKTKFDEIQSAVNDFKKHFKKYSLVLDKAFTHFHIVINYCRIISEIKIEKGKKEVPFEMEDAEQMVKNIDIFHSKIKMIDAVTFKFMEKLSAAEQIIKSHGFK